MKKYLFYIILIAACGKDNEPAKDYKELFKKSVWSGEIKHEDKTSNNPYSMVLDADGTFEWWEGKAKSYGVYVIDNAKKELVLNFASGASVITRIQNDNTLSGFTNASSYPWTIVSAGINKQASSFNYTTLTGTVWNLKYANGKPFCKLTFTADNQVRFDHSTGGVYGGRPYTLSGGAIEFAGLGTDKCFGVINEDGLIRGIIHTGSSHLYPWLAMKQ